MKTVSVYPDYLDSYLCKCGACRRTCCQNDWDISLSRSEYQKNCSTDLPAELTSLCTQYMSVYPNGQSEENYAFVRMQENGECALLNQERLCSWQLLRGESVGCVCIDFPRIYIEYFDREYVFLSSGCEAVLEVLLKKETPIRLCHTKCHEERRRYYAGITAEKASERPILAMYPELTDFGMKVLENRRLSLRERLQLLVFSFYQVDHLEKQQQIGQISATLRILERKEEQHRNLVQIRQLQGGAQALVLVCGEIYSLFYNSVPYGVLARRILDGLGVGIRTIQHKDGSVSYCPFLQDRERYLRKMNWAASFWEEKSVFFEHVLVSIFLQKNIPMCDPDIWGSTRFFAAFCMLLKGGIAGCFEAPPEDESLIDLLVALVRMFVHSNTLYQRLLGRLDAVGLTDLQETLILAGG